MFIIAHGEVDIIIGDAKRVASLKSGQLFAEAALLQETTRNADVRASSYCDLYKLNKTDFLTIIQKYPELLRNMQSKLDLRSVRKAA